MCCVRSTDTFGPEHLTEERELGAAQARARGRRGADRAVVLDEQHARARRDRRRPRRRNPPRCGSRASASTRDAQRSALGHGAVVRGALHLGARVDDLRETLVAERGAHRGDQLDGEIVVTIGEEILGEIGERPDRRRAAAALGRRRCATTTRPCSASASRCWRTPASVMSSAAGEIGHLGVGALQPLDDPALGRAEVRRAECRVRRDLPRRLDVVHQALDYRNRTLAERTRDR